MPRLKSVLIFCLLLLPRFAGAEPCWGTILARNNPAPAKEATLLILPFENTKNFPSDRWLAAGLPLLLRDYLSLSKKMSVIPPATDWWEDTFNSDQGLTVARRLGATHLLIGRVFRPKAPDPLQIETIFIEVSSGKELKRINATIEIPGIQQINDLLTGIVEEMSKAEKRVGLDAKKIRPFLNTSGNMATLPLYIAGSLLLLEGDRSSTTKAIAKFEEAIRQDYNYVPGYLGLAEALVSEALFQGISGAGNQRVSYSRARQELEKARTLNPFVTQLKAPLIEKYLVAYVLEESSNSLLAAGKNAEASSELQKLVTILPGHLIAHRHLVNLLPQAASTTAQEEHAISELSSCHP